MLGKLIPCGGGAPVPLGKPAQVIGRNLDCDIAIACKTVSGRHCELRFRDGGWWVRDLGSKNGTAVNGVKKEEQRVGPNDVLSIGRQRFILSFQAAEPQPSPAAADEDVEALALKFLSAGDEPEPTPAESSEPAPAVRSQGAQTTLGHLVPCGGGDTIPLLRSELVIGRHPDCDICLRFPSVSAKHCKLIFEEGYWYAQDLQSRNGTWVDGTRCLKKCLLPQSVLALARHRFTIHYAPTAGSVPEMDADNLFAQSLLEKAGLLKLYEDRQ